MASDAALLARVNLEGTLFSDRNVDKLAHKMGWTVREALGCLALIWHRSQTSKKIRAHANEINDWAMYWDEDDKLIKSLVDSRFITPVQEITGETIYVIAGTEAQLNSIDEWRRKKSNAGKAGMAARWNNKSGHNDTDLGDNSQVAMDNTTITGDNSVITECNKHNSVSVSVSVSESESESEKGEGNTRARAFNTTPPGGILVELWQKYSGDLPKVLPTHLTSHNLERIRQRLEENPDPAYWEGIIKKIANNPFLRGENKRGWKADFFWLIDAGNHEKVDVGRYENNGLAVPELDMSRWV